MGDGAARRGAAVTLRDVWRRLADRERLEYWRLGNLAADLMREAGYCV